RGSPPFGGCTRVAAPPLLQRLCPGGHGDRPGPARHACPARPRENSPRRPPTSSPAPDLGEPGRERPRGTPAGSWDRRRRFPPGTRQPAHSSLRRTGRSMSSCPTPPVQEQEQSRASRGRSAVHSVVRVEAPPQAAFESSPGPPVSCPETPRELEVPPPPPQV